MDTRRKLARLDPHHVPAVTPGRTWLQREPVGQCIAVSGRDLCGKHRGPNHTEHESIPRTAVGPLTTRSDMQNTRRS